MVQARLPRRAAPARASRSPSRWRRRSPTPCSRSGSSCWPRRCSSHDRSLDAVGGRRPRPSRPRCSPFLSTASPRACSADSATASPSPSRPTWPGCRRRSPRSPTRSGPSCSTACRCCGTRCSCSTTSSCRCSAPPAWILRLVVTMALLASIHPALVLLAVFALPDVVLARTLRPAWSGPPRRRGAPGKRLAVPPVRAGHHRAAWQGGARHRHRPTSSAAAAARRGRAGTAEVAPGALDHRGLARRRRGRCSRRGYVGAVVFVASGLHRPPGDVLLVLAAGRRLSRTSGRRSARSGSSGASG